MQRCNKVNRRVPRLSASINLSIWWTSNSLLRQGLPMRQDRGFLTSARNSRCIEPKREACARIGRSLHRILLQDCRSQTSSSGRTQLWQRLSLSFQHQWLVLWSYLARIAIKKTMRVASSCPAINSNLPMIAATLAWVACVETDHRPGSGNS